MKRIVSIALIIMMVLAMTVSVSALTSPGPKDYYKITVGSEGKGHATSDHDKVQIGTDGTVTFNAYEDGGFFTKWVIDGKYEVVSGSEYDDVFVIRPRSDINAIAYFSEEKDYLNVYVSVDPEGYGEASADPSRIKKSGDGIIKLTASGINGGKFREWLITGDYEIVEGDLNSETLVIRAFTDIYAVACFNKPGETPTEAPKPDDNGNTSPKTGYPLPIVFGLMALAMFGGTVAYKKIKE